MGLRSPPFDSRKAETDVGDAITWSMDELAAANMLGELGIDPTTENLARAAAHFARHRRYVAGWAAQRVHADMVSRLEQAAMSHDARPQEAWREGFRFAQHQLMTAHPSQSLDEPDPAPSKGQILRGLLRRARAR